MPESFRVEIRRLQNGEPTWTVAIDDPEDSVAAIAAAEAAYRDLEQRFPPAEKPKAKAKAKGRKSELDPEVVAELTEAWDLFGPDYSKVAQALRETNVPAPKGGWNAGTVEKLVRGRL